MSLGSVIVKKETEISLDEVQAEIDALGVQIETEESFSEKEMAEMHKEAIIEPLKAAKQEKEKYLKDLKELQVGEK